MNIYSGTPYTYYISWTALNLHYYGVRYANHCHPNDFWKKYFTSSTYVNRLRKNYGEPDIIQVRKVFSSVLESRKWESTVLRRIKALDKGNWLNCANQSIKRRKNFDGFLAPNFGYIFTPMEKVNKSIQYKKYKWWNNGISQCFCEVPPNSLYIRGRLAFNNVGAQMGANISKLKKWYTDGVNSVLTIPGSEPNGYVLGRKIKNRVKPCKLKGSRWWTNGNTAVLAFVSPGPEWRNGRR